MKLLVTGGAGYIGSVMTRQLLDANHTVTVVDDCSQGHKDAVDSRAEFVQGDIGNMPFLDSLFTNHSFDGVFHFSGVISMKESMENPGKYFTGNTSNTIVLLEALARHKVRLFIFSSTAGVYGNPVEIPIPEHHPKNPTNPYGESKLMIEKMLPWFEKTYSIHFAALRYFNAAGATLDGVLGERHKDETHIIPCAISAVCSNQPFTLYGEDYETKDGTCVRDYIHIEDLCKAHLLTLNYLNSGGQSGYFNVGTGQGYSNKEIITAVEKVSGKKIRIAHALRRPGDSHTLIADPSLIKQTIGWQTAYSSLNTIIKTAWQFHTKNN